MQGVRCLISIPGDFCYSQSILKLLVKRLSLRPPKRWRGPMVSQLRAHCGVFINHVRAETGPRTDQSTWAELRVPVPWPLRRAQQTALCVLAQLLRVLFL